MAWDGERARRRSIDTLSSYGIQLPEHLPLLFDAHEVERLRGVDDVVSRIRALYGVMAVREGAPVDRVRTNLDALGASSWLTDREREFFERPGDEELLIPMSWRVEAVAALGWAVELVDELPLEGAEGVPATAFEPVVAQGDPPRLSLRPAEVLADRLDLFYCAHWAAVEQQLTRRFDPWPEVLWPGAIVERRHGLEWLFEDPEIDWEDVELST